MKRYFSQVASKGRVAARRILKLGVPVVLAALLAVVLAPLPPAQVEAADFTNTIETKLTVGDAAAGDYFGQSVAIREDTAVVGAPYDDQYGNDSGSAYVFLRSEHVWSHEAKLTAGDAEAFDHFGQSVAIDMDIAVVGAPYDDDAGHDSGAAYVFVRSGNSWIQEAKLTAGDAAADDQFGYSVALSGDTAVVGADRDDDAGADSGAAYVFERSGTSWSQEAKLTAGDAAIGDYFGESVALRGDTAVVGAYNDDGSSGSAYVFERSGTSWSQQAKLTAGDAEAFDQFGCSVAVFVDTAVVGALGDDDAGSNSGSAYVFLRSGTGWSQQAKLTAGDAEAFDQFGCSVALSGDTAVVGANFGDAAGATNSGAAYVFLRSGTGWSQEAKLAAGDAAAGDRFGYSVATSGGMAVVGAHLDDDAGADSGSAYVFERSGTSWGQEGKLTASDDPAGDQFGQSVAISGDIAVVGAFGDNQYGSNSGAAYVFVRSGTVWSQEAKLTASDAAAGDRFGQSVAISGDIALVGAPYDDDAGDDSGSAYVFVRSGNSWSQGDKLTADDAAAENWFGWSVAISGDTALVGAPYNDDAGDDSGLAYVFVQSKPPTWSQQQKLIRDDATAGDQFGWSVAISGDTAVVGATGDDDAGDVSGSAYVFVRSGGSWTLWPAKLTAADAAAYDAFGASVALSGDTAVVGASGVGGGGAAYVFVRSGTGWSQKQKLTAGDAAAGDAFGRSVALSGDMAVVGAYSDDDYGSLCGSAYVFVPSWTTWSQEGKLTASDAAAGDHFGWSVAISGDTAVVGAFGDDDYGSLCGSAYVYEAGTTEYDLLQARVDVLEADLSTLATRVDGVEAGLDAMETKVSEIELAVKKLDVEVVQSRDSKAVVYHIGASLGGQPVYITLDSAKGMTRTIADQPWSLEDVTGFAIPSSAGEGHLRLWMDALPDQEYPMFQFTVKHDDGGTTWYGTVLIENSNSTAWKRP